MISALYHVTKPELVEKQKMHKADLIHFERIILTSQSTLHERWIVSRNYKLLLLSLQYLWGLSLSA